MTPAWIVALLVLLMAIGTAGYRFGADATKIACDRHDEAQQQVTIAAEKGVIVKERAAGTITQNTETDYGKNIAVIEHDYDAGLVQSDPPATGVNLSPVPNPACRTSAPKNSRKFSLTPQQCDIEEQKLISLWGWIRAQAAVN